MKSRVVRPGTWVRTIEFVLLVICLSGILQSIAVGANLDTISVNPEVITFIIGESTIVKAPWPTVRVAVTDPTIANVEVLTPEQVLLQGTKVGSTDLIVWSEDESQARQWKVQVRLDTERYKEKLIELFPDASLEVSDFGETLIVKGLLRNADQAVQLHDYLTKTGTTYVDMTSVAGAQQVQVEIRVAEVSRQALRAMGFNAFHTDDDYFGAMRIGSIFPVSIGPAAGQVAGDTTSFVFNSVPTASPLVTIFGGFPRADFEFFLQALAENQYLRVLANPTLVALNGEEASFLAGGEFPIPVPQSGTGGSGTITIQYKEYGVRVSFRPTVLGDGSIRLHVAPEVSERSSVEAVVIQGSIIPTLITRKAETTLEVKSGQTFAMAGLLQNKVESVNSRVPGLGDLPVLGPLFRSVRYQKNETELVIMVTASLVEPMSLGEKPPLPGFLHSDPNDWEFYLEGRLEGKEPAKIHSQDAEWLKQMTLDRLMGPGAWDSYNKPISSSQADRLYNPSSEFVDTQKSQENGKE
ncbi:type II and III secretion system protein family protein [Planctomycetota bacterium]